ncbi:MAG TPA: hypothetical protein VGH19_19965 [Verrucomicrobiae bacterium]
MQTLEMDKLGLAGPDLSGSTHTFTRDGSMEMENQIRKICQGVMEGIRHIVPLRKLQAVLLGGGYGRGEGGVFHAQDHDTLYNDMEFYVFISGVTLLNEKLYGDKLRELGEKLGEQAGVDVDFKILSLAKFRNSEASMFFYDLAVGHKWLYGQEELFKNCLHHKNPGNIPMVEGTRLLMNRCTGLLLMKERMRHGTLLQDFAGRNLAKLQLAMGDALLTAYGRYHSSCLERGERVQQLQSLPDFPWLDEVKRHHAAGVEFKLHPTRNVNDEKEIKALFNELANLSLKVWLWLENRRLNQSFATAREYAMSPVNKYPKTKWYRNWVINVIRFGPEIAMRQEALRYPRERLFNTLPLLLWESLPEDDLKLMDHLQEQLQTFATTPEALVHAYTRMWEQVR